MRCFEVRQLLTRKLTQLFLRDRHAISQHDKCVRRFTPMLIGKPDDGDFKTLKALGYDFAVVTLRLDDVASWKPTLDAAQSVGMKLMVGAYPPPYVQDGAAWTITSSGMAVLTYLQTRADVVIALYVFNEPYSSNPYAGGDIPCGFFSAGDLRTLRSTIQGVWPGAKIYQDLGGPSQWAPGGSYTEPVSRITLAFGPTRLRSTATIGMARLVFCVARPASY